MLHPAAKTSHTTRAVEEEEEEEVCQIYDLWPAGLAKTV
jgi:hypothetical protein